MKITAVTQDQLILVDGTAAMMAEIGGYNMQRGEWAVHFDTELGIGHIEYLDNRANQVLDSTLFNSAYAWLIDEHQRYVDFKEAEANEQQQAPVNP